MHEVNFYNNFNMVANMLKILHEKNPNILEDEIKALTEIFFYVNTLQIENRELGFQRVKLQEHLNKFLKEQI